MFPNDVVVIIYINCILCNNVPCTLPWFQKCTKNTGCTCLFGLFFVFVFFFSKTCKVGNRLKLPPKRDLRFFLTELLILQGKKCFTKDVVISPKLLYYRNARLMCNYLTDLPEQTC